MIYLNKIWKRWQPKELFSWLLLIFQMQAAAYSAWIVVFRSSINSVICPAINCLELWSQFKPSVIASTTGIRVHNCTAFRFTKSITFFDSIIQVSEFSKNWFVRRHAFVGGVVLHVPAFLGFYRSFRLKIFNRNILLGFEEIISKPFDCIRSRKL